MQITTSQAFAMAQGKEDNLSVLRILNCLGLGYFWSTLLVFIYTSVYIYIPALYQNDTDIESSRTLLAYFILAQVLVNYFLTIYKHSYFELEKCRAIPNSSWGKCLDCDQVKPPKTHHCPCCRRCILKRDHHCFLTTVCVGFRNLRFMIVYSYYSAAAAAYTFYLVYEYVKLMYSSPFTWENWYHYAFPITTLEFLMGKQTFLFVLHVGVLYWSVLTFIAAIGMATIQLVFPIFNMTQRDIQNGKVPDFLDLPPLLDSFRRIFGPWAPFNFIIPLICFEPKGDGINLADTENDKLI